MLFIYLCFWLHKEPNGRVRLFQMAESDQQSVCFVNTDCMCYRKGNELDFGN